MADRKIKSDEEWAREFFPMPKASEVSQEGMKALPHKEGDMKKELLGRASNMLDLGLAGLSVGGPMGGIGGGALGALVPVTSDTPLTNIGATAAEAVASKFIPGMGAAKLLPRIGHAFGVTAAAGAGAALGNLSDEHAGFVHDTDFGPAAIYTGVTAGVLGLSALKRPIPGALDEALTLVKKQTGVDIPLSVAERSGKFRATENLFGTGSTPQRILAEQQNKAGSVALDSMLANAGTAENALNTTMATQDKLKGILKAGEKAATEEKTTIALGNTLDAFGQPTMITKTKKEVNWDKFDQAFGLDKLPGNRPEQYRQALFAFAKGNPEQTVDRLVPRGGEPVKGLMAMDALRSAFEAAGEADAFAPLGTALVSRILQNARVPTAEFGEVISGRSMMKALNDFGEKRLNLALGEERVNGLKALAMVMETADPARKLTAGKQSMQQRQFSYISNKGLFALTIGGMSGAGIAAFTGAIPGMIAGGTIALSLSTAVNKIMQSPKTAKLFVQVSQGDGTAATQLARSFMAARVDEEKAPGDGSIASRLKGFLGQ